MHHHPFRLALVTAGISLISLVGRTADSIKTASEKPIKIGSTIMMTGSSGHQRGFHLAAVAEFKHAMAVGLLKKKYAPEINSEDQNALGGRLYAMVLIKVLQCAEHDLTRETILTCATSLKNVSFPLMIPGATYSVSPNDYKGITRLQMMRFDGQKWVTFGDLIDTEEI